MFRSIVRPRRVVRFSGTVSEPHRPSRPAIAHGVAWSLGVAFWSRGWLQERVSSVATAATAQVAVSFHAGRELPGTILYYENGYFNDRGEV